jgi:hypothetical protein
MIRLISATGRLTGRINALLAFPGVATRGQYFIWGFVVLLMWLLYKLDTMP